MAGIKDVAKKAGVSISTVSNVMNGNRYVSEDLIQRVHTAIDSLDYEVDLVARSLKNNKTMTIGVILTSMNRIFIPQVLNGMQHSAEEHGYNLLIYTTNDDIKREKKYLKILVNSKADGIILDSVAPMEDEAYYKELAGLRKGKKKIPVVCIERDLGGYGLDSVFVNNVKGAYTAVRHLVESGCRRIVHVSGPCNVEMVLHRTLGYRNALEEFGIACREDYQVQGDFSPLSGYRAVLRLLNDGIGIDGIFADNDQMAIGAIKALKENGYSIPRQVKLVGFDNTFVSSIVRPALTTINVPKYRMGKEVTELLCKRIGEVDAQANSEVTSLELATNLLVRESTGGKEIVNWDLEGW